LHYSLRLIHTFLGEVLLTLPYSFRSTVYYFNSQN